MCLRARGLRQDQAAPSVPPAPLEDSGVYFAGFSPGFSGESGVFSSTGGFDSGESADFASDFSGAFSGALLSGVSPGFSAFWGVGGAFSAGFSGVGFSAADFSGVSAAGSGSLAFAGSS